MASVKNKNEANANRQGIIILLLLVVMLAAAVLIFQDGYLGAIDSIRVVREGDTAFYTNITDETLVKMSGYRIGDPITRIDEESAAKNINELGYISYVATERTGSGEITLRVRLREPRAVIQSGGNNNLIDREGYVLAHLNALPTDYNALLVTGVVLSEYRIGQKAASLTIGAMDDVLGVVNAIYDMGYANTYSTVNMETKNLYYLITKSGMIVQFNNVDDIDKKLAYSQSVIDSLIAEGKSMGRLYATADFVDYRAYGTLE